MEFEFQTIPMNKIPVGTTGVGQPLCNTCIQAECGHPIRTQVVSIAGIPTKWRLWSVNNVIRQVVSCKGYINEEDDVLDED